MRNQLQKAIDLLKKTGDRLLIFDSAKPDSVYVIMGLKDYENLIFSKSEVRGLTEDELLDKINRDVAIWKSENDYSQNKLKSKRNIEFSDFDFDNHYDDEEENYEDDIFDNIDDINDYDDYDRDINFDNFQLDNFQDKKKKLGNIWSIPKDIKEGAEEVIEEDRQYLEDIF